MAKKDLILNIKSDQERLFYNFNNSSFSFIETSGENDGESAFKCCEKIVVDNSIFKLRYPFWHDNHVDVLNSTFFETCRGPFWYSYFINFSLNKMYGDKAFRECRNIKIDNSFIKSNEIFWRCRNIEVENSSIEGEYAFFLSNNISFSNCEFKGKYSFQYVKNVTIRNAKMNTKDPFWHAKNVTCIDCIINAEYVAWYAKDITFIRCKISSKQPFCCSNNLKFIDCEFIDCDLSFEKSDVHGNAICNNVSLYNPKSGELVLSGDYKIIEDEFSENHEGFILKRN